MFNLFNNSKGDNLFMQKVSVCIATYNMGHLISETIENIKQQTHKDIEIIVYDDCSTDNTCEVVKKHDVTYIKGEENKGVGGAFNEAIAKATGEYVILMCADDLFLDTRFIEDVVCEFMSDYTVGHVTRYYSQFIDKSLKPVRSWRCNDPIVLANNPSGLAFRTISLYGCKCSNRMFIETSQLVHEVLSKGWKYRILRYDAIGARVHASTSTQAGYYLKRRVSSPVMDWHSIGGKSILKDYVSLVQISVNYKKSAVIEEIVNFIKLRPLNLLSPMFWFYSISTLILPRQILRNLPHIYRKYIGKLLTRECKR